MSKKKRDLQLFVVDILVAIQKIKQYTIAFDNPNDFQHSSLHWDATIRQLEIIGEALNKLLEDQQFNSLSPTYFRKVVNFRNSIVHGYFGIDVEEVWNVISYNLNTLEQDILLIVKNNIDITQAIECEIEEYKKLNDTDIVKYLMTL